MAEPTYTPLVIPHLSGNVVDIRDEKSKARTRGYAEGYAEGRRIAAQQAGEQAKIASENVAAAEAAFGVKVAALIATLTEAQAKFEARSNDLTEMAASAIETLAVDLAEHILGTELSDPALSAAHAMRRAFIEAPGGFAATVLLSERDLNTIAATAAEQLTTNPNLSMEPSDEVDDGGVLIKLADGSVDARISAALGRVRAALCEGTTTEGGRL